MEFIAGLFLALIMFSPFLIAGFVIFTVLALITIMASKISPVDSKARSNTMYIGLSISLCVAIIFSVPLAVLVVYDKIESKSKPKDDAIDRLKNEMRREGRDKVWPAGTVTTLEQWVDVEGGQFRDELRLELANNISMKIDANNLQTNDTDFAYIEALAQHPHAVDRYSDYLVASAIAYVHIQQNGFGDVGHPERFRRSPGHNPWANQTDYTTYLKVAMVRCTQEPQMPGCRETFTEAEVNYFETLPEHSSPLNWLEKKQVLTPLRAALGYPPISQ